MIVSKLSLSRYYKDSNRKTSQSLPELHALFCRKELLKMEQKNNSLYFLLALTFCFLSCDKGTTTQIPSNNSNKVLLEKTLNALVVVEVKDREGQQRFGSGFFVCPELIATCFHVVAGATTGTVKLVGTELKSSIQGIISDEKNGLALLQVSNFGVDPLPVGNSSNSNTVQIGKDVHVIGTSQINWKDKGAQENKIALLEGTIAKGVISNVRKGLKVESLGYLGENLEFSPSEVLEMTVQVDPGSSGGPVLNDIGEVIGIAFMSFEESEAFNFAIPSNYLRPLLDFSDPVKPLGGEQSISAYTYYLWGYTKVRQKRYEAAIADFDEAILLDQDYTYAYNDRGVAKMELGRYDSAIVDYDTAIRLKPDYAEVYSSRGLAKEKLGRYDSAIVDYDTAIRLKPDYAQVYLYRGVVKQFLNQYDSAIADYDAAIRLILPKDDLVTAYYNRGLAKQFLGQHEAAIANFDEAIRLKPDLIDAYINRGSMKFLLTFYDSALVDFDTLINLKPGYAEAYYSRGLVKRYLRQYKSAITDFDTAISLTLSKPYLAEAYYNRGNSKYDLGQHDSAIVDYNETIRLEPNFAKAYYGRGTARLSLGQHDSAVLDFDEAIYLNPNLAEAYLHRGLAKTVLDRTNKAKSDFQTALKLAQQSGNDDIKTIAEQSLQNLD